MKKHYEQALVEKAIQAISGLYRRTNCSSSKLSHKDGAIVVTGTTSGALSGFPSILATCQKITTMMKSKNTMPCCPYRPNHYHGATSNELFTDYAITSVCWLRTKGEYPAISKKRYLFAHHPEPWSKQYKITCRIGFYLFYHVEPFQKKTNKERWVIVPIINGHFTLKTNSVKTEYFLSCS